VRSSISIDVEAPPRLVFELARNVERWPDLLPHYRRVRVVERHDDGSTTARMVATRAVIDSVGYGIPVAWRARVWADADAPGLRFRHLGGATNGMDVTWRIEPTADGCHVTIEHDFAPRMPGWAALIDRSFVRPIAGRTLATFKSIAEAAAAALAVDAAMRAPRSTQRPTANKSA
jgi:ribosome-associated toxin RatA of RatAB toxin-antitoxin module